MELAELQRLLALAGDDVPAGDVAGLEHVVATARRRRRGRRAIGALVLVAAVSSSVAAYASTRSEKTTQPAGRVRVSVPAVTSTTAPHAISDVWTAYDYGEARISIPSGWTATTGDCRRSALVAVDAQHPLPASCSLPRPQPFITVDTLTSLPSPFAPNRVVHGIPMEYVIPKCDAGCPDSFARIPSLQIAIGFYGRVDAAAILERLSRSTVARLRTDPLGVAPSGWTSVTSNGFTLQVPPTWRRLDMSGQFEDCTFGPATIAVAQPNRGRSTSCSRAIAWGGDASAITVQAPVGTTARGTVIRQWRRDNVAYALEVIGGPITPELVLRATFDAVVGPSMEATIVPGTDDHDLLAIIGSIRLAPSFHSTPPSPTAPCDAHATEPTFSGRYCGPAPHAGNGHGPNGRCDGTETEPPCAAGVVPGRYYAYTLPGTCDGSVIFAGRRWVSMLPPPTPIPDMYVWMGLNADGTLAGFIAPQGAVGIRPDTGAPPTACRG